MESMTFNDTEKDKHTSRNGMRNKQKLVVDETESQSIRISDYQRKKQRKKRGRGKLNWS